MRLWNATDVAPLCIVIGGFRATNDGQRAGDTKRTTNGGLAYTDASGTVNVYHADGLGSVRAITDGSGTVVQTYRSDAYGVATSTQGAINQHFQYTGQERDEDGLVFLRGRVYNPALGRFMQRDPLAGVPGLPLSLNRYSYASNNPVNRTDPSGLCSDPSPGTAGARYCVERFIPTAFAQFPIKGDVLFRGDNRGASANSDDAYRVHQEIYASGSPQVGSTTVGITHADTPFGVLAGRGTLYSSLTVAKSNVLGDGRSLRAYSAAGIGVLPPYSAPPILTDVRIEEDAYGNAFVSYAAGTPYPSLEVWQYGGSNGPQLLFYYDAIAAGTTAIDLFDYVVFIEQA
jgi:RHS repeat-associated protein